MRNTIKKAAAGLLALVLVAGAVPANVGSFDLFESAPIMASAEDTFTPLYGHMFTDGETFDFGTKTLYYRNPRFTGASAELEGKCKIISDGYDKEKNGYVFLAAFEDQSGVPEGQIGGYEILIRSKDLGIKPDSFYVTGGNGTMANPYTFGLKAPVAKTLKVGVALTEGDIVDLGEETHFYARSAGGLLTGSGVYNFRYNTYSMDEGEGLYSFALLPVYDTDIKNSKLVTAASPEELENPPKTVYVTGGSGTEADPYTFGLERNRKTLSYGTKLSLADIVDLGSGVYYSSDKIGTMSAGGARFLAYSGYSSQYQLMVYLFASFDGEEKSLIAFNCPENPGTAFPNSFYVTGGSGTQADPYTFSLEAPVAFSNVSLTLSDDLGLNFIIENVTEDNLKDLTVKLSGECEENGETVKPFKKTINGKDYYCVTANVPAKNMDDAITAELYSGDELIDVKEYSVSKYLGAVDTSSDPYLKDLVAKTAQYGEAAKYYFTGSGDVSGIKDHKTDLLDASFTADIHDATMSLVLKSRLAVRLYIPGLEKGAKAGSYEAVLGTSNRYCFEITGITPVDLGKEISLSYGGKTYKFSPMSWCQRVMKRDDLDRKNYIMANAVYEYYMAAKAYTVPGTIVDLSKLTGNYEAKNGDVLTGKLAGDYKISVAKDATITLRNATITGLSGEYAGITCENDARIILEGENTVKGGIKFESGLNCGDYPGIYIAPGYTLTIDGTGSLYASGSDLYDYCDAAGIGGGYNIPCGNIHIKGGDIEAVGRQGAAGIGGAYNSDCGNIIIEGGDITSICTSDEGAGIGSGYQGSCGDITIKNTVKSVTATKGGILADCIGKGSDGTCGTVTIEDGANVTLY